MEARAHRRAVEQARRWVEAQRIGPTKLEVIRLAERTPVLFFDARARRGRIVKSAVLYGHLDKQPEMTGWRQGFGPWTPVIEDGRLYGRGGADDGYAVFAAIAAIKAIDAEGIARPRCIGLIETCEESGSYDLPAYLDALAPRMGEVGLVIALDSGAGNYDQLWVTTSLRGLVNGTLRVDILTEGVHSGDAGGVVPSSFRIARQLLDRVDDSHTGAVKDPAFQCDIPADRLAQAKQAAGILGESLWKRFPWSCCGDDRIFSQPVSTDPMELILNRTWRAALAVTGADGTFRIVGVPPGSYVLQATTVGYHVIRNDFTLAAGGRPPFAEAVARARSPTRRASRSTTTPPRPAGTRLRRRACSRGARCGSDQLWGKSAAYMGEGGTIPFMAMLNEKFPRAQLLVTGVLGPKSNAHGPTSSSTSVSRRRSLRQQRW